MCESVNEQYSHVNGMFLVTPEGITVSASDLNIRVQGMFLIMYVTECIVYMFRAMTL